MRIIEPRPEREHANLNIRWQNAMGLKSKIFFFFISFFFWQKLFKQQEQNLYKPTARVCILKSMAHFQLNIVQPVCGSAEQYDIKQHSNVFQLYDIYLHTEVFF